MRVLCSIILPKVHLCALCSSPKNKSCSSSCHMLRLLAQVSTVRPAAIALNNDIMQTRVSIFWNECTTLFHISKKETFGKKWLQKKVHGWYILTTFKIYSSLSIERGLISLIYKELLKTKEQRMIKTEEHQQNIWKYNIMKDIKVANDMKKFQTHN